MTRNKRRFTPSSRRIQTLIHRRSSNLRIRRQKSRRSRRYRSLFPISRHRHSKHHSHSSSPQIGGTDEDHHPSSKTSASCEILPQKNTDSSCDQKAPDASESVIKGEEWLSNDDIDGALDYMCNDVYKDENIKHINFASIDFTDLHSESAKKVNVASQDFYKDIKKGIVPTESVIIMPMNIDVSTGQGTHWTANYIFMDQENNYQNSFYYYFDSALSDYRQRDQHTSGAKQGNFDHYPDSVHELYTALRENMIADLEKKGIRVDEHFFPLECNKTAQQKGPNECGMYVLFFFYLFCSPLGKPLHFPIYEEDNNGNIVSKPNHIFKSLQEKKQFLDTNRFTDDAVHEYRKIFFKSTS